MEKMISIIVPVYQGEKTIERCVTSILNSTYRELEVIVVDDGSTDKTREIVAEIAQIDQRVRLIQGPNQGVSHARNTGLQNASGEFIGFVDADDFITAEMYERMLSCMTQQRDMVICASQHCDQAGVPFTNKAGKLFSYERKCPEAALQSVLYERITMAVWSKLFRRKHIVSETGKFIISFHEQLSCYEDLIFICEYIKSCSGNIFFLPERLYNYCYIEGSLSRKERSFAKVAEDISALSILQEKYGAEALNSTDLFCMETVWKYWILQVLHHPEYRKLEDFTEHTDIQQEIRKYQDTYFAATCVPFYKKCIVKMILSHGKILFGITKLAGKVLKV